MNGSGELGTSSGPVADDSALAAQPTSPSPSMKTNGIHTPFLDMDSRNDEQTGTLTGAERGTTESATADNYAGASIFRRGERPPAIPSQSFVVGGGKHTPRSGSFDNRMSWKGFSESLPRFPTISSIPSMPSMPEMPNMPFIKSRDSTRRQQESIRRARSQPIPDDTLPGRERQAEQLTHSATSPPNEGALSSNPLKQKLADLHIKHPNLKDMSKPLLPIAVFPNQGTGKSSEFNQEAPIWARQPFKLLYFIYFGLSIGLFFLPWFAFVSLFPSKRARPSWNWKRSTLIKLFRHGARLTFRTYTSLSRDITKEVPHSKTVRGKFVWVAGLPDELIRGQVRSVMKLQNIQPTRTCGFWYGERDGGGGVGQMASAGEKVIYHLHGGAYWIGTAHEKDVTSAVNMQALRALDAIYEDRLVKKLESDQKALTGINGVKQSRSPSPHPPAGGPAASTFDGRASGGLCKRAFSLDYRLCVPGAPEMGSYPAALLDALAGYRYLVIDCGFACENIIVAGDSAGGNLALAMCRYLRDEKLYGMPGAMILLSPWADASRSHAGPISAPNKFSTTWTNRNSDIISPSTAFRNTAVSALLGRLAAGETYRNPYISSNSLQLPADKGGSGPSWGFEGFPRRIYICTGSAELSYDQHLTLAYRLAGGTTLGRPIHSGDQLSIDADSYEMAARLSFPRPKDCEITLWPSAHNIAAGTPLYPPNSWKSLHTDEGGPEIHKEVDHDVRKIANGYPSSDGISLEDQLLSPTDRQMQDEDEAKDWQNQAASPSTDAAAAHDTRYEAGKGLKISQVKEKDTQGDANVTHEQDHDRTMEDKNLIESSERKGNRRRTSSTSRTAKKSNATSLSSLRMNDIAEDKPNHNDSSNRLAESSYFELGREDRTVVLDECKDAVHDYTLFNWYEPERGQTWARIAKWIDEEV